MDLDAVDWSAESHAYGPATDVPELLQQLQGKDSGARRRALDKLTTRIAHQGWASPVATRVAPFLLETLAAAATPGDQARLLVFLGNLAPGGNHESSLLAGYGEMTGSLSLSYPAEPELHQAVAAGAAQYRSLLAAKKAPVRAAAAFVLGMLGPIPENLQALARQLTSEKEPEVRCTVLLSLGLLLQAAADKQADELGRLREATNDPPQPLVRAGAACGLAWAAVEEAPIALLLELADQGLEHKDVPYWGGKLSALALLLAGRVMACQGDFTRLEQLFELCSRHGQNALEAVAKAILQPASEPPEEVRHLQELTPAARSFLEGLLAHQKVSPLFFTLHHAGLMPDEEALAQFLRPDPNRIMERLVDGKPLWKHAWRVTDGLDPVERWFELIGPLSREEKLRLVQELSQLPYEIGTTVRHRRDSSVAVLDLLVATIRHAELTSEVDAIVSAASAKLAAGLIAELVEDQAARIAWVKSHLQELDESAGYVARRLVALVEEALEPAAREQLVLNAHRGAALFLAETTPTPAVAKETATTASFGNLEAEYPDFTKDHWQRLLACFGKESLPAFEAVLEEEDLGHRDLFEETVQRLRSQG